MLKVEASTCLRMTALQPNHRHRPSSECLRLSDQLRIVSSEDARLTWLLATSFKLKVAFLATCAVFGFPAAVVPSVEAILRAFLASLNNI